MDVFNKIKREVKTLFKKTKGSHDWDHTMRVLNLCAHIGKKEAADLKILKFAALLHDIGRSYEDESSGKVCHAAKGAELAGRMLKKYGLSRDETDRIIHCIQTHRFRGRKKPLTREAKVLFDADKLDSIGAVGIGRAFLFAGEVGAKLHNKGVNLAGTKPYTEQDTAYREWMIKLRKVRDRIFTKEAKRLAEERHGFMEEFFNRLNREVDGNL